MSLENVALYVERITLLLPMIEKIVDLVEKIFSRFFPSMRTGEAKQATAMKMIQGYVGDVPEAIIADTIDVLVKAKNQTGEFAHAEIPVGTKSQISGDEIEKMQKTGP